MGKRNTTFKTKLSVGDIASTINEALEAYENDITDSLTEAADIAADAGLEVLKSVGNYNTRGGNEKHYRDSFEKVKKGTKRILRNRKYQISHLLEYGHALREGGRASAYPHWSIAEDKVIEVYQTELKKRLK